jgi:hypothetical protein
MANYFSELYADQSTPSVVDGQLRAGAGVGHARMRYAKAVCTPGAAVNADEKIVLKQFKSSDRINYIYWSSTDSGTGGLIDIGLYKTGANHDGVAVDRDLFSSAYDIKASDRTQISVWSEAGTLDQFDRGKTLWELATKGAASYTADPMEDWDLVATPTEATTDAAMKVMVEIYYTSGD